VLFYHPGVTTDVDATGVLVACGVTGSDGSEEGGWPYDDDVVLQKQF
jgi:hypothetical protein